MKIGIYLPTHLPGDGVQHVREWARRAEDLAFDTLAISDRTADPLLVATTAAIVTSRISLLGDVTYGPGWTARMQAEHSAGLDRAAGGRYTSALTFPAATGGHGLSAAGEARSIAATLAEVHRHWRATLPVRHTMPLLVGGPAEQTAARVAAHGDGWLLRAGTPEQLAAGAALVGRAWSAAGRPGCPTIAVAFRVTDATQIGRRVGQFRTAGADLVLGVPATTDVAQLDGLAAAVRHPVHA